MKKLVYLLIVACAVAACSPKEIVPVDASSFPSSSKKFYAKVEQSDTKVYNVGKTLYWVDRDSIAVFDKTTAYDSYAFAASTSDVYSDDIQDYISEEAVFALKNDAPDGDPLSRIYAVHPLSSYYPPVANTDGSLDLFVWDDQTPSYGFDKIDTGYSNVLVAVSDNETLNFKNVCGYIRIPLLGAGQELSYIELVANGGESIVGEINVTFDGSDIPVATVTNGEDTAYKEYAWSYAGYVQHGPILSDTDPLDVIFCLVPGALESGFTVNATDIDGNTFTASVSGKVEIKRNIMTSTAPLLFPATVIEPATLPYLEDFESNPVGWTYLDADGDGSNWQQMSIQGVVAHSGAGALLSASYDDSSYSPLTPDNWAYSRPVQLKAENYLSFWIGAQSSEYYAEHYAVYILDVDPAVATDAELLYEDTVASSSMKNIQVQIPSAYSDKVVWIAFRHFNCTDMYYINLDDVEVLEGKVTPPYVPTYDEYLGNWKAGAAVFTIEPKTVGSTYSISGLNSQGAYELEAIYDTSGNLVLNEQTVYDDGSVSVALKGVTSSYQFYSDNTTLFSAAYDPDEDVLNVAPASGFSYYSFIQYTDGSYSGNTSLASIPSVLQRYVPVPDTNTYVFKEDFENGISGWTMIDSDDDGNQWSASTVGAHAGYGALISASYSSGALTPDNWAFTPAITFTSGNYISFWVAAQDPDWPDEHYAVYLTDADSPSADESLCTKLMEETIGEQTAFESEMIEKLTYRRFVLEVPAAYEGKTGYIGFRHFDCSDNFRINLDDVYVTEGLPSPQVASSSSGLPAARLSAAAPKPVAQTFCRARKSVSLKVLDTQVVKR